MDFSSLFSFISISKWNVCICVSDCEYPNEYEHLSQITFTRWCCANFLPINILCMVCSSPCVPSVLSYIYFFVFSLKIIFRPGRTMLVGAFIIYLPPIRYMYTTIQNLYHVIYGSFVLCSKVFPHTDTCSVAFNALNGHWYGNNKENKT